MKLHQRINNHTQAHINKY